MTRTRMTLELAQYNEEDQALFQSWRDDPVAIAMSFSGKVQDYSSYYKKYFSYPEFLPVFCLLNGKRIGFIAGSPYMESFEISILIAKEYRKKGYAKRFLELLLSQNKLSKLYARIRPENKASISLFESLGFKRNKSLEVADENVYEKTLFTLKKEPLFIIAEAGSNWRVGEKNRDLEMAEALIEAAKSAGCDAVKFQTYKADSVYVMNAGTSDYLQSKKEIFEIFEDLSMPHDMVEKIAELCKKHAIEFMSTPFSIDDFRAVDPFVKRHKIASYEMLHVRLLELAAKSDKPLYLSTGASNLDEVVKACQLYKKMGGKHLTLMQCTAQYPADPEYLNISAINTIRKATGLPVGLSDHSLDPIIAPVMAVAQGASVIEKHFTLSRKLPGPDHCFALEPNELKKMVEACREAECMVGSGAKVCQKGEKELFLFAKRAIQAICPIQKGDTFIEGRNIDILRPGKMKKGISPEYMDSIVGKQATRDIQTGEGIQQGDYS